MAESSACEGSRRTHIRYGLPVPRSADNGLSPSAEVLEPQWVLAFALVNLEHVERQLRERLDALGPARRAELLHVLMLPDFERADAIGEFWGYPESRAFAELLIDGEEESALRAVLIGLVVGTHADAFHFSDVVLRS